MPRGKTKNSSKRGLASADQRTRERVASEGGKSHDRSFFQEIGRKGGRK
jgi:general stress protein YciG